MRAAIYVRISKDVAGLGLGVERQETECRALAERLGYDVTVLSDNDISAFTGKHRPAYERLLEGLKAGQFEAVIVWATDRLYRRVADLLDFITVVQASGARVLAVNAGPIDLSTASGQMNAISLANFNQYESAVKSERILSQRRQMATTGAYTGGPRAFGFESDGVTHRPAEVEVIRWAMERLLDGWSLNRTANAMPLPTPHGNPWTRAALRRMVIAPRLVGLRTHHGEIAGTAAWEPVVERADWERLRAVLTDPARKAKRPPRSYLLAGMVVATDENGTVLAKMGARPDNGTRRYLCLEPIFRSITAEPLEDFVSEAVLARFDETVLATPVDDSTTEAVAAVVALEGELAELADARGHGLISLAEWLAAREPLQARLEAARAAVPSQGTNTTAEGFFARPGALREAWEADDDIVRRREILASVVERIEVGPRSQRGGKHFETDRIRVVPRR